MGTILGLYDDIADDLDEAINLVHGLCQEYRTNALDELLTQLMRMRDSLKKIVKSEYAEALGAFNRTVPEAASGLQAQLRQRGATEAQTSEVMGELERVRAIVNDNYKEVSKTGRWFEALALIVIAVAVFVTSLFYR